MFAVLSLQRLLYYSSFAVQCTDVLVHADSTSASVACVTKRDAVLTFCKLAAASAWTFVVQAERRQAIVKVNEVSYTCYLTLRVQTVVEV